MLSKISILFVVLIGFISILFVNIEIADNSEIDSFTDAIWWSVTTSTRVGYGDIVPVTFFGKLVAMFLMVFGLGLTSAIGALFVKWMMDPTEKKILAQEKEIEKDEERSFRTDKLILKKLNKLEHEIEEIKSKK